MHWLLSLGGLAVSTVSAFVATNIDELAFLVVLFGQGRRVRTVVLGLYLGFAAIVAASLIGSLGAMLLRRQWVGLLGLVPLLVGIRGLVSPEREDEDIPASRALGVLAVFAITVAGGGDNVAVYVPLFALLRPAEVAFVVLGFLVLVGAWCWLAHTITRLPGVRTVIDRWGHRIAPVVLCALGIYILVRAGTAHALVQMISSSSFDGSGAKGAAGAV
jgi:cadmium resistance transport/sequestration family protein